MMPQREAFRQQNDFGVRWRLPGHQANLVLAMAHCRSPLVTPHSGLALISPLHPSRLPQQGSFSDLGLCGAHRPPSAILTDASRDTSRKKYKLADSN